MMCGRFVKCVELCNSLTYTPQYIRIHELYDLVK